MIPAGRESLVPFVDADEPEHIHIREVVANTPFAHAVGIEPVADLHVSFVEISRADRDVVDVAIRPCSRKPIEYVVRLADVVDLVEDDHDGATECVEFLVEDVEDSLLGVTGSDAVLPLTNQTRV